MLKYIGDRLAGGFDLVFLFGRGIEKFSGTKREAMISLILPFVLFFFSLGFSWFYPPKGMTAVPHARLSETIAAQYFLSFILGSLMVAGLAKSLGVLDRFWLYFSASNWAGVSFSIITVPLAIAAATGYAPRDAMDPRLRPDHLLLRLHRHGLHRMARLPRQLAACGIYHHRLVVR